MPLESLEPIVHSTARQVTRASSPKASLLSYLVTSLNSLNMDGRGLLSNELASFQWNFENFDYSIPGRTEYTVALSNSQSYRRDGRTSSSAAYCKVPLCKTWDGYPQRNTLRVSSSTSGSNSLTMLLTSFRISLLFEALLLSNP